MAKTVKADERDRFRQGFDRGFEVGDVAGSVRTAQLSWHSVDASIKALEKNNKSRAISLLRILQYALADVTGRKKIEKVGKVIWQKD